MFVLQLLPFFLELARHLYGPASRCRKIRAEESLSCFCFAFFALFFGHESVNCGTRVALASCQGWWSEHVFIIVAFFEQACASLEGFRLRPR